MIENTGIVILGLGPGSTDQLTLEARKHLEQLDEITLRSAFLPLVSELPDGLKIHSFDDLFEEAEDHSTALDQMTQALLELARRKSGVTYAVPGSPWVGEASVSRLLENAKSENIPVRVIDGLSFLQPTWQALGIDPVEGLVIEDALHLSSLLVPPFPPSQPALITQLTSREMANELKLTLMVNYPDEYPVHLVHQAGLEGSFVEDLALYEIDHSPRLSPLSSLYLPARENGRAFEDFQQIIARLRALDGCPWDREQTHLSLRPYLIQETYEVIEALDQQDPTHLQEELGDLLLQIVLHAQIATENLDFNMTDILEGISSKIVRRHPHVFGEVEVASVDNVLTNWEQIKADERKQNGDEGKSMLDGVPLALPALTQADQIQRRAQWVGFDWQTIDPVIAKIQEELEELMEAGTLQEKQAEAGDLLFAVVNLIRWLEIDPETALRETNLRFRQRFAFIEENAAKDGRKVAELSFEELDALWEQAKDNLSPKQEQE